MDDHFLAIEEASHEPPDSYYQRHRCSKCGGYLRDKPDREGPPTSNEAGWHDYDCRKCEETTTYEF